MALQDIAGVFSRFFIVGFFLPVFFAVLAFAEANPWHWWEPHLTGDHAAGQVLVLGGAALLGALLLVGIRGPVHAVYSGYRPRLVFGVAGSDTEIRHDPEFAF